MTQEEKVGLTELMKMVVEPAAVKKAVAEEAKAKEKPQKSRLLRLTESATTATT